MPRAYSYLRFSSKKQEKGESRRRQWDFATEVSTENGWVLDDTLTLTDLGVSAFRGKNAKVGALAEFLEAVRIGRVLRGSVLIVESIDRLSRNKLGEALQLFISLLNAGIEIVTKEPRRHYTRESINDLAALIEPLVYMMRAHEESATKAYRLRDVWGKKKERAREKGLAMTKMAPRWLELVRAEGAAPVYRLIPGRAATVRAIFQLSREGMGAKRILNYLVEHSEEHPPFGDSGKWRDSYVTQILNNRAVFGEFQPGMRSEEGDRLDCGNAIPNYFPAVVTEEEFYAVQAGMRERHLTTGRPGTDETNLFTGIVHCVADNSRMFAKTFRQSTRKGAPTKAYRYLCDGSVANGATRRGKGLSFPYDTFERGVLSALTELTAREVAGNGEPQVNENERRIVQLSGELFVFDHKIEEYETKVVDLELSGAEGAAEDLKLAKGVLKGLHKKKADAIRELEQRKADTARCQVVTLGEVKSAVELLEQVRAERPNELEAARRKLKARIRALVTEIWVDIEQHHKRKVALVRVILRCGVVKELKVLYSQQHRAEGGPLTAGGDCFVVADKQGRVWDGERWFERWSDGVQYNTPGAAYEDCETAIEQVELLTGERGFCWYIPPGACPEMRLRSTRGFDHLPPAGLHAETAT